LQKLPNTRVLRLPKYDTGNYNIYSGGYENKIRFLTRMTTGFGYGLSYIPTGILLGNYISLILAILAITLIVPAICHLRLKDVAEEGLIGTCVVLFMFLVKVHV